MKTKIFTLAVLFAPMLTYGQPSCKEVFISEYIDGPFKNKVLEIFNPTDSIISLIGYSIKIFQNGAPTPLDIPLLGNVNPKETYVIAHPQADTAILAKADQIDVKMNFDGNDAVVLNKDQSTYIDKIGEIGIDPGTNGWSVPPSGSTKDHDLRRQYPIDKGETDWNQGKNQWDVFPGDSAQNIRQHKNKCAATVYVQFAKTSSSVKENIWPDNAHISITISQADNDYDTKVDILDGNYACQYGTQTATGNGVDYYFIDQPPTYTWYAGQSSPIDVQIAIQDDALNEGNETVCLHLQLQSTNPNAYLGTNEYHLLTITDNDGTGINEYDVSNKIKISPNPANDELVISINGTKKVDFKLIKIVTIIGEKVMEIQPVKNLEKLELNVKSLSPGMYFITFYDDGKTYTQKFIKQ